MGLIRPPLKLLSAQRIIPVKPHFPARCGRLSNSDIITQIFT